MMQSPDHTPDLRERADTTASARRRHAESQACHFRQSRMPYVHDVVRLSYDAQYIDLHRLALICPVDERMRSR
jgi:hypothetical protein